MAVQVVTTVITRAQEVPCNCSPWWRGAGLVIPASYCIAAYTPIGASSLANSYDNNAAPANGQADGTHDLTVGGAPSFNALTGWTFNGIDQNLVSDINPTTTTIYYICARVSDYSGDARAVVMGFYDSLGTSFMIGIDSSNLYMHNMNYYEGLQPQGDSPNTIGIDFEGVVYTDGYARENGSGAGSLANYPLYVGSSGKSAYGWYTGKIQAIALYNNELSPAQISALHSSMMALPDYADG